jgi:hypothetical protein
MKNEVLCKSCNAPNPAYRLNCSSCGSYLRDRAVNIDLWKTLALLLYSPSEGFKTIRNSEHKNFIVFLFVLIAMKLLQGSMFISLFHLPDPYLTKNLIRNYLIAGGLFFSIAVLFSFLLKVIAGWAKTSLRFWDNFAVFIYAFFPYGAAFVILFPLEYVIFAEYLFSINPSWFALNAPLAYMFSFLEGISVLWGYLLMYFALKTQTNSKVFSMCFSLVFIFITYLAYFVLSKYLFM